MADRTSPSDHHPARAVLALTAAIPPRASSTKIGPRPEAAALVLAGAHGRTPRGSPVRSRRPLKSPPQQSRGPRRDPMQRRTDYCGGLRSGVRVARAMRSPTRSWARASWKGLSRFCGLPAAGSWRTTPRTRAGRLKTAPIKAVHTLTAALKEDQTGLRIRSAFRTAVSRLEQIRAAERHALGWRIGQRTSRAWPRSF